jgi:signal transduction histidine kinase
MGQRASAGNLQQSPPAITATGDGAHATQPILTLVVGTEFDVIASRLRARQIAALCGFGNLDQARIATAISELARNIFNYASAGSVAFAVTDRMHPQQLVVTVQDSGPGIANLELILSGGYRSTTGMGLGILAARRLMEQCDIRTGPAGTSITVSKPTPAAAARLTPAVIGTFLSQLDALPNNAALSEAQQQNRELTAALSALQARQDELLIVSARLEETNQRVEALNVLLDEKADALQRADRSKDEFLAILSHELRGPLSAAGIAAQLLSASSSTPARTEQMSEVITRQVSHMTRLVEDLLDVSRVSRGLVLIDKAPVNLGHVISWAVEQVTSSADKKRHALEQRLPALPVLVMGDRIRLVQVVSNLLGNAIRYTPEGGKIAVHLDERDGVATVTVTDNGIGLHADFMPRLFDLYVQAERTADRTGGGLGLGLALVKNLVEAHGGTVTAYSDGAGHGSTFSVRLPVLAEVAA